MNDFYESEFEGIKPNPGTNTETVKRFIKDKYVSKKWTNDDDKDPVKLYRKGGKKKLKSKKEKKDKKKKKREESFEESDSDSEVEQKKITRKEKKKKSKKSKKKDQQTDLIGMDQDDEGFDEFVDGAGQQDDDDFTDFASAG